jgi:hypothetical protein
MAGLEEEYGKESPIASMATPIVFAAYIPPQEPEPQINYVRINKFNQKKVLFFLEKNKTVIENIFIANLNTLTFQ